MDMFTEKSYDVIVVGAGNAALCAAHSAKDLGAEVLVLERAPQEHAGGNSRFTGGVMRTAFQTIDDIKRLVPDLSDAEIENCDFGTYPATQFYEDMCAVTNFRCNPRLTEILVDDSLDTLAWMREKGVRFVPSYAQTSYVVDGRRKFWAGPVVEVSGAGPGLVNSLTDSAIQRGIDILYDARALSLIGEDDRIVGLEIRYQGKTQILDCDRVVLACGGFEANLEWRTRYLGPGWEHARVRGTYCNTGDGLRMALDAGAAAAGNWSGCHSTAWDQRSPEFGDFVELDRYQRLSYQFGIMVNAKGLRFFDEGEDLRNRTYAKLVKALLEQPGQFAWQIFDAKAKQYLYSDYDQKGATKVTANSLEELAAKLEGVDAEQFLKTVEEYNRNIDESTAFDPSILDGRSSAVTPPRANWARAIDTAPYEAYAVTCGITFTFGGLRINKNAQVLNTDLQPIRGLYAAGEMVGDIFHGNYLGASGLTCGAVFGRRAGSSAANESALNT
jgi:tricarballylate dehydrogenase